MKGEFDGEESKEEAFKQKMGAKAKLTDLIVGAASPHPCLNGASYFHATIFTGPFRGGMQIIMPIF